EWLRANRGTATKLARAIVRTLGWMHGHTPQEIAAKAPASFRGEDDAVYAEAVSHSVQMFSSDGVMAQDGAEAVRTLLADALPKVKATPIDLSKTYTNEFINGR